MKKYLLTGVDEDTWSLLKACCAYNKITVKSFFHQAIDLAIGEFLRTDFYKEMVKIHSKKEDD